MGRHSKHLSPSVCEHKQQTNHNPFGKEHTGPKEPWWCYDCGIRVPSPFGCGHRYIDELTECCIYCGEKMQSRTETAYLPDTSIAVGVEVTYECVRCESGHRHGGISHEEALSRV